MDGVSEHVRKRMTFRDCAICGDEFLGSTNAKYCSPECRRAGQEQAARLSLLVKEQEDVGPYVPLPATRGDCVDGCRPCRHSRCRWHLGFEDVETCTLDIADRAATGCVVEYADIGRVIGVSKERVRQIIASGLQKLQTAIKKLGSGSGLLPGEWPVRSSSALAELQSPRPEGDRLDLYAWRTKTRAKGLFNYSTDTFAKGRPVGTRNRMSRKAVSVQGRYRVLAVKLSNRRLRSSANS